MQLNTTYLKGDMKYLHRMFGLISGYFLNIEPDGNSVYQFSASLEQITH